MALQLNVDQILANKSPKWHKRLPKFIIRLLERIIHQDEINGFLRIHGDEKGVTFAQNGVQFLDMKFDVVNPENIPATGRYIIVSNHPLGGLDGIGYIGLLSHYREDLKFPVNDLLLNLKPFSDIFVPINKHGRQSMEAVKALNETFESDNLVFYFPAGLCSRRQKGVIKDLDWKGTIVSKAKQYERDIIPVHFEGQNSNFFYNLANFRKKLGIKFNIEMLFLPDEMFKQRGKTFKITFGKPITYKTFTNDRTNTEWAAWLREETYKLANCRKG